MQQWRTDAPATNFDVMSMERSKGFVKALQELKNLRPQLYSAAEYCEKSYLHNEQKQIVLENLKDYAVRALVNAVDHLGTVAYKLTDLLDQQAAEAATVELKVSSLNQRALTALCFMDKENLRQRQLFPICPRHHKHYIMPVSVDKAPANGHPPSLSESNQSPAPSIPRPHPLSAKTLLWHLSSESNAAASAGGASKPPPWGNAEHRRQTAHEPAPPDPVMRSLIAKDSGEGAKNLSAAYGKEIIRPPLRSKSMLAAFFVKNKYPKQKKALVL